MSKKYTKIPADTFKNLQLNAGILLDSFNPATGEIGTIIGATSGGVAFATNPEYTDFAEDIDNAPKNMKEMKQLTSLEPKLSGTFVSVTAALAKMLVGAADSQTVTGTDVVKIVPRSEIANADFQDVWWVGDYSDVNTGADAGFMAIHLINAFNTSGFQIQSTEKAKGTFSFEFTGHYSMANQEQIPYELYILGGGEVETGVYLDKHSLTVEAEGTATLTATTSPASQTVTWTSSNGTVASVSGGVITAGESAGSAIITASITVDGVTYSDTCTVIVTAG